jgi:type II secretory pathway pseudopilin PulG
VTRRDRITIGVVVALIGLAAFYMLALKPKRQEAAQLRDQVAQAQQKLDAARTALAAGRAARATYAANYATVAKLGKAVPTDDDIPGLVYQLDTTAQATGVDFRSVKLTSGSNASAPAPPNAAAAAAATSDQGGSKSGDGQSASGQSGAAASGTSASSSSSSSPGSSGTGAAAAPATGTTGSPAAATQTATAALPPGAVVGPAGLNTMPFSFSFEGSFFKLSDFLTRLERYIKPTRRSVRVRGRLLLVDGIALTAAANGFPAMKASIAATAYLLPASQGLFNGASPQGPTATGVTPVSAGTSGSSTPAPAAAVTP